MALQGNISKADILRTLGRTPDAAGYRAIKRAVEQVEADLRSAVPFFGPWSIEESASGPLEPAERRRQLLEGIRGLPRRLIPAAAATRKVPISPRLAH
jgi:hypothetical protein